MQKSDYPFSMDVAIIGDFLQCAINSHSNAVTFESMICIIGRVNAIELIF